MGLTTVVKRFMRNSGKKTEPAIIREGLTTQSALLNDKLELDATAKESRDGALLELQTDLQISDPTDVSHLRSDYFHQAAVRVKTAVNSLKGKKSLDILLFSSAPEFFGHEDLISSPAPISSIAFVTDESRLDSLEKYFDLAIVCTHVRREHKAQFIIRGRQLAPVMVAWTFDNHHSHDANRCSNALADIILPAHRYCGHLMKTPHAILGQSVPLCCTQWPRALATRLLDERISIPRSDSLYGGYVLWRAPRIALLQALKDAIPNSAISLIDPNSRKSPESYFRLSTEEQFLDWSSYKVSIALPFSHDLSMRVFDALMSGQIPLVPDSCYDLDYVIPQNVQESLPILRFKELSVPAIREIWCEAVRRYDELGMEGIYRRHAFARDFHHVSVRLRQIVEYILGLANEGCPLILKIDESGVGLVAGCSNRGLTSEEE
jgi:hypothetical protein